MRFLICLIIVMNIAPPFAVAAENEAPLRVLDVEKRRVVIAQNLPSDAGPTCEVLVIGGGTGGVAAAQAAAGRGVSVILVEPTRAIGGQFTSQLVPVPDENRYIEAYKGASTTNYRNMRRRVRAHYRDLPDIKPGQENCVGQCWVSRVSGTPDVWEKAIAEPLEALRSGGPNGGHLQRIYRRHQLARVGFLANGRVNYADIVDLDSGRVTRIGTQFLLDATEDGLALDLAGCPTVIGQEAKADFNEPHAPEDARPDWVQSFTYCFLARWQRADENAPRKHIEKPAEYEYFKQVGEYTLNYEYIDRGTVPYQMLKPAKGAGGPFWTYRRLIASSSFKDRPASPEGDIALINWRGNDFHEQSYIGVGPDAQAFVLERAKNFAQGFFYFLQNEAPRDEGGFGYPEIQPIGGDEISGVDENGFALHPYIRESRRLKAKFTLNENHLIAPPDDPKAKWGEAFKDSVGCALYAVDIHPAKGEPPLLIPALPYHIPLGSFLPSAGPANVIPAAKNIGATRLAMASARMHPTEWLIGETAGALAAFCLKRNIADPSAVREDAALLSLFQGDLRANDYPLYWQEILPPDAP